MPVAIGFRFSIHDHKFFEFFWILACQQRQLTQPFVSRSVLFPAWQIDQLTHQLPKRMFLPIFKLAGGIPPGPVRNVDSLPANGPPAPNIALVLAETAARAGSFPGCGAGGVGATSGGLTFDAAAMLAADPAIPAMLAPSLTMSVIVIPPFGPATDPAVVPAAGALVSPARATVPCVAAGVVPVAAVEVDVATSPVGAAASPAALPPPPTAAPYKPNSAPTPRAIF